MALTITNTNALGLLNILNRNSRMQSDYLTMLTTGKRINRGSDDPAGLLALNALEMEATAVHQSLSNNQRTDTILTVADGAIGEVQKLLGEIESLVVASTSEANLTSAEIAANQAQIDDALAAIDRIVQTTNFNGNKLLDGSYSIDTDGVAGNSNIENLRVFSRSQATSDTTLTVHRQASAQVASAVFALGGGNLNTSGTTEVVIAGTLGTASLTLASGLTQAEIVSTINLAKAQTGVSAIQTANSIELSSTTYGSDAFISVEVLSGGAMGFTDAANDTDATNDIRNQSVTSGVDATVTINGQSAGTDGLNVSYNANGLSLAFTLGSDFGTGNVATEDTTFTVKASGGATFQLGTTASTRATIGIDSLASYNLGGGNGTNRLSELKSGGAIELKADAAGALTAVREAMSEVAGVRGRLGGFQKFQVQSSIAALQASEVGLENAKSVIADTDYAVATAGLNQSTVLLQSSISLLGLVNQQSSQILALLG
ncbi:MAG: hypothetical protein JSV78_08895 [Phycisphaerales bacterium]|nr:MAG: hypothetical protein JSV78_08895 [Phycisphaerales bacterium]